MLQLGLNVTVFKYTYEHGILGSVLTKTLSISNDVCDKLVSVKFLRLLLIGLFFAGLREGIVSIGTVYLLNWLPTVWRLETATDYGVFAFSLSSFLSFLISPVILFLVFYRLGKRVDLEVSYPVVTIGLFMAGLVGSSVVYFLLAPVLLGGRVGVSLPDTMLSIAVILNLILTLIGFGLSVLFPAFVAIALANFRSKHSKAAP